MTTATGFCPSCGAPRNAGAFCASCGEAYDAAVQQPPTGWVQAAAPSSTAPVTGAGWNAGKGKGGSRGLALAVVGGLVLLVIAYSFMNRAPSSTGSSTSASYIDEYGGQSAVYSQIAATNDCAELQALFDTASSNNDRAEPGTNEHRWTLGYMTAAVDQMKASGCP